MNTVSHLVVALFQNNIVLTLPLMVLAFKFAVRWTAREKLKDVFRSLLTVPLDFVYIAVGLIIAALARRLPQFAAKYSSDREADLYGAILLLALFIAAVLVTVSDRVVRLCWQKAFAAMVLLKEPPQLPLREADGGDAIVPDESIRMWLWLVIYWVGLALLLPFECVLSVLALGGILKLLT